MKKIQRRMFNMLTITYFVHGITTDNELDLATHLTPGELSELGIQQSKKLKRIKLIISLYCLNAKKGLKYT